VVHLELHTPQLRRACATYAQLCGWPSEHVCTRAGDYTALGLGDSLGGGVVECGVERALWLPYVRVGEIHAATQRASGLGARVLLEPREGPAGWRAVVRTEEGGELALWQPKRCA
jgi:predicted enzyme related to lactoylglutathione lyase